MKKFSGWTSCLFGLLLLPAMTSSTEPCSDATFQITSNLDKPIFIRPFSEILMGMFIFEDQTVNLTVIICQNITNSAHGHLAAQSLRKLGHPEVQFGVIFMRCNVDVLPPQLLASMHVSRLAFFRCNMSDIPNRLINSVKDSLEVLWTYRSLVEHPVIPANGFQRNDKMTRMVWLSSGIERVDGDAFLGLPNLIKLMINDNKILSLDEGAFNCLTNLKELHLVHNKIRSLDDGVFDHLTSLEILDMEDNNLTTLSDGLFDSLEKLKIVHLNGNPLHCDCELKWLQDWHLDSKPNYTKELVRPSCGTPMEGHLTTLNFCNMSTPVKKTKNKTRTRDCPVNEAGTNFNGQSEIVVPLIIIYFLLFGF